MDFNSSSRSGETGWLCECCGVKPEPHKAKLTYMGANFDLMLPRCPKCGQFFIDKELAEGKMREAELLLEDK